MLTGFYFPYYRPTSLNLFTPNNQNRGLLDERDSEFYS